MSDPRALLEPLLQVHDAVRDEVVAATERQQPDALSAVSRDSDGDTIYAIDVVSERVIDRFATALARDHRFVLVAEGVPGGRRVYPDGVQDSDADWCIIVDPIDGTRGLMYQKRSAWILTGVAPNRGAATSLRDIALAIQTEIPLVKQHLSDQIWALRGAGITAQRINRVAGRREPIRLSPSTATTIAHGYATISRFFPGARDELAAIDEEIVRGALGPVRPGKAHCFEDQYACTGGQLYELMAGHDRFIADLRPLLEPSFARRGEALGICCHPYDICTALIAEESGVVLTDPRGDPLNAPLNVDANVAWVGFANAAIRNQIEPLLRSALQRRAWIA
jgi:fructose-1,6-bisphosphatase/inositol monophosphatase family enzyme